MPMKNFEDIIVFSKEFNLEKNNKDDFTELKQYFREEKKENRTNI